MDRGKHFKGLTGPSSERCYLLLKWMEENTLKDSRSRHQKDVTPQIDGGKHFKGLTGPSPEICYSIDWRRIALQKPNGTIISKMLHLKLMEENTSKDSRSRHQKDVTPQIDGGKHSKRFTGPPPERCCTTSWPTTSVIQQHLSVSRTPNKQHP